MLQGKKRFDSKIRTKVNKNSPSSNHSEASPSNAELGFSVTEPSERMQTAIIDWFQEPDFQIK